MRIRPLIFFGAVLLASLYTSTPASAEITLLPSLEVALTNTDVAEKMIKLTQMLEDLDDVQEVFSNADIPEELYEKLAS